MRISIIGLLIVVASLVGGCRGNPIGPGGDDGGGGGGNDGGVNDKSKGLASASYAIYEGDCPQDPAGCSRRIYPTEDAALMEIGYDDTFLISSRLQKHTIFLTVEHPGIRGRTIEGKASGSFYENREFLDEADAPSPARISTVFDLVHPSGNITHTTGGRVHMFEKGLEQYPLVGWRKIFWIRVVRK